MAPLNMSLDAMPSTARPLYEQLKAKRGTIDGMYLTLLNHPDLAEHVSQLGTYLRFGSTLPAFVREITILMTAHALGSEYEWIKHEPCAREAAVPAAVVEAIRQGESLAGYDPVYGLLQEVHQCVVSRRSLPPAAQDAVLARWGTLGLLELVVLVGFYAMINGVITSFDVPLPTASK